MSRSHVMSRSHTIEHWDPEDTAQWESGGRRTAMRNLYWSVFAEHVGFSVWTLFAVMVLFMPQDVYGLDAPDKFLVSAVVTLTGAFLRIPYTLATATFGGRNWTMFSAFVLLVPALGMLWIMANPGQPLWAYLVTGALAGLGGANFASSMTNINAFFPQRQKGWALGLNAGGGNLGVATIQVVGLLVIAAAGNRSPHWVIGVYLVLLVVAGVGAGCAGPGGDRRQARVPAGGVTGGTGADVNWVDAAVGESPPAAVAARDGIREGDRRCRRTVS